MKTWSDINVEELLGTKKVEQRILDDYSLSFSLTVPISTILNRSSFGLTYFSLVHL